MPTKTRPVRGKPVAPVAYTPPKKKSPWPCIVPLADGRVVLMVRAGESGGIAANASVLEPARAALAAMQQ